MLALVDASRASVTRSADSVRVEFYLPPERFSAIG